MQPQTRFGSWMIHISLTLVLMTGCARFASIGGKDHFSTGLQPQSIDLHTKAEACRLTAIELAAHEKDEHAIAQFEQAREFDPNIEVAHSLAVLYDRQGRLDAAAREYERAIQESPRNADVHNDFGYFLYSRGDYPAARSTLNQALKIDSQHSKARINLAMVLAAEGSFEAAYNQFEQVLGPSAAHRNIGLLQLRSGNQKDAIAHLQKSAAIDPSLRSDEILANLMPHPTTRGSEIIPVNFEQNHDLLERSQVGGDQ